MTAVQQRGAYVPDSAPRRMIEQLGEEQSLLRSALSQMH
jgi:hypothetical protein